MLYGNEGQVREEVHPIPTCRLKKVDKLSIIVIEMFKAFFGKDKH